MDHHSHFHSSVTELANYLPLIIIAGFALFYIILLQEIPKEKKRWNKWRIVSFTFGLFLLAIALHPTVMTWAHMDMRGHMVQHLLLAMYAPIFLVLGAPLTLILKTFPTYLSRKITAILKSSIFHIISHPLTALLLNTGGMYILYLTPLYNQSLASPSLHYLIHFHFLTAGYLFTWSIITPDPVPKKHKISLKIFVLFLSIGAHAYLSKFMYAHLYPLNSPHNDDQLREGAKLMYYWGDLAELLLVVILFTMWYYNRGKKKLKFSLK